MTSSTKSDKDKYNTLLKAVKEHIRYIDIMSHWSVIKFTLDKLKAVVDELESETNKSG